MYSSENIDKFVKEFTKNYSLTTTQEQILRRMLQYYYMPDGDVILRQIILPCRSGRTFFRTALIQFTPEPITLKQPESDFLVQQKIYQSLFKQSRGFEVDPKLYGHFRLP